MHKVDVDAARLRIPGDAAVRHPAVEQIVNYVDMAVHWAADSISPTYDRAPRLAPAERVRTRAHHAPVGDARMSNILYAQDHSITGVLDWEIAYLGDHEADLAWMLFLDRASSEFEGHPALPGTPTRAESIARYEEQTGWKVRNLDYNEVLAAVLLAIPIIRMSAFPQPRSRCRHHGILHGPDRADHQLIPADGDTEFACGSVECALCWADDNGAPKTLPTTRSL